MYVSRDMLCKCIQVDQIHPLNHHLMETGSNTNYGNYSSKKLGRSRKKMGMANWHPQLLYVTICTSSPKVCVLCVG